VKHITLVIIVTDIEKIIYIFVDFSYFSPYVYNNKIFLHIVVVDRCILFYFKGTIHTNVISFSLTKNQDCIKVNKMNINYTKMGYINIKISNTKRKSKNINLFECSHKTKEIEKLS